MCHRRGQQVAIVEMPLYRAGASGEVKQSFASAEGDVVFDLNPTDAVLKREMVDCYVTQLPVLRAFSLERERFRRAPAYDFAQLPNGGRLLYEAHDWGLTGSRWRELVKAAQTRLGWGAP
jgi:hypothetical protein